MPHNEESRMREMLAARAEARRRGEPMPKPRQACQRKPFVPTPDGYREALGELASRMIADPADRDIQSAVRALAQAAQADKHLEDLSLLQKKIRDLQERYEKVVKERDLAINDRRVDQASDGPRPSDEGGLPIH